MGRFQIDFFLAKWFLIVLGKSFEFRKRRTEYEVVNCPKKLKTPGDSSKVDTTYDDNVSDTEAKVGQTGDDMSLSLEDLTLEERKSRG